MLRLWLQRNPAADRGKNRAFKRSIGEVTDIVEKEMYTLTTKP
jgi:hypothetical protein